MRRFDVLLFGLVLLLASSCRVGRFVVYNTANITDYKKFPSRTIQNGGEIFTFEKVPNKLPIDSLTVTKKEKKTRQSFEDYLIDNGTVAFLVIRNDTILYEQYFNDYNQASIVNSFSMAKSVTSMLIGCAIDDGLIESTQQAITDYLPELKENGFDVITIEHLLDMSSGIKFNEGYVNPFGHVAGFYYGTNLRKQASNLKLEQTPGTTNYRSCDTQFLGLILERVLKEKTISEYLEEKIWLPLGMEYPASWSLDRKKDGIEKTFCCLNARARDFAKLGRLYLNHGEWEGKQIVSKDWVLTSTQEDPSTNQDWYNNQWWLQDDGAYEAQGILGQFISVHPQSNMIMVRLGKRYGKTGRWSKIFKLIESQLNK